MSQERWTRPTREGPMDCHVALPEAAGAGAPVPGVVVVQEAYGVNGHVREVCARLAGIGYAALAPEIFHREGAGIEVPYDEGPRAMALLGKLTNAGLEADLGAALAALRDDPRVAGDRVGVVGFCVGGFAAFLAACRLDPRAAVAFYGGGIVRQRPGFALEPVLEEAGSIKSPLLCLFGGDDAGIPPADVEAIRARLDQGRAAHEVVVYPGAKHAFFNDRRPQAYHAEAAREAWQRAREWLGKYL